MFFVLCSAPAFAGPLAGGAFAGAVADISDFVGRPLADVRVELAGQPFADPAVLELIQTRVGQPLRLDQVRASVDHLVNLGRFEDIQVFAESSAARPGAVALRWVLQPVRRIERIDVEGSLQLDRTALRSELNERFGVRPSLVRLDEIVALARTHFSARGYRTPRIEPHVSEGEVPELVRLTLNIEAGGRTAIRRVEVTGHPQTSEAALSDQLQVSTGKPYDAVAIDERVARYEEQLRNLGHYEANIDTAVTFSDDHRYADLVVDVDPGPRVKVEFAGDPLPASRQDTLVPIRQERSVDLDLLEDSSRNIEGFLRQQGYRSAQASYTREQSGGEMVIRYTVSRGALFTFGAIDIVGNNELADGDLTPLVNLEPGGPFVDSRVATVATAIAELYRVHGYARASVRPNIREATDSRDPIPVSVQFVVSEGPRSIVGEVSIAGTSGLDETRVRALLGLTSGKPFYRPLSDSDRTAIERLYRNEGFLDVRVTADAQLADDGRRIDIRWNIHEGERTTVDHVLVTGNVRTSTELIRREIALKPGEPLGDDALVESQRRLAALGLFRRVRIINIAHGSKSTHDVLVEVEEAPSTSISEGGGVEAVRRLRPSADGRAEAQFEVAPRGFFDITRRNLWGKNRSVSLFTRVSYRPRDPAIDSSDPTDVGGYGFNEYRVVGTLREPRPFNRAGQAQFTAFLEQAVRSSFNFRRSGGRAEYARQVGPRVTVSGRYAFDYTELFDEQIRPEDRALVDRLFPQVRLSTFTASVLRDARSGALDPEGGYFTGVDVSVAPRFLGSEVGFVRTYLQGSLYRRLPGSSRFVVAAAAKLGLAAGFPRKVEQLDQNNEPVVGVVKDVPASERFFAGGDTTVRGFVLDQLGAEDTLNAQGFPSGGTALIVLNLELRAPHLRVARQAFEPVVFIDAGNVFKQPSDLRLREIRPAVGFGVRWASPIGPLRFDLGFNPDPRVLPSGIRERRSVFHISLGQAF